MRTHEYVPPVAQHYVDELAKRGLPCEVRSTPRSITVVCATDRVRATAEFRRRGKHWDHVDATLTVDGRRCQTVSGFDELERVLADPGQWLAGSITGDETKKLREVSHAPLPEYPADEVPVDDPRVPTEVRLCASSLATRVAEVTDAQVRIELAEDGVLWQIRFGRVTEPATVQLVFCFTRHHNGSWGLRGILMVRPGDDHSLDLGTSVSDALAALNDHVPEPVKAVMPRKGRTKAPRSGKDLLEQRTHTIIRN